MLQGALANIRFRVNPFEVIKKMKPDLKHCFEETSPDETVQLPPFDVRYE